MVKALSPRHAKQPTAAGRFALNALSLIAVNLFMRTVGVAFNAYLAGRAGGEVMGLYSLLFGVYGLAMTLGSAGIHLGTTRMVADVMGQFCPEENGAGEGCVGEVCRRAIRRVMVRCLTYSLVCGAGAGLLMLVSAPWIGREWLGDGRTVLSRMTSSGGTTRRKPASRGFWTRSFRRRTAMMPMISALKRTVESAGFK